MTSLTPEGQHFDHSGAGRLWQRYCGFLEMDADQFMEIQEYLLLEQIDTLAGTPLGRTLFGGRRPRSIDEFQAQLPLTTYDDYAPFIGDRQEDGLPERPFFWCHSAGRGGNFKWIPYTRAAFDRVARYAVAVGILSAADERGDVRMAPGFKVLVNLAPRPYASGSLFSYFSEYFPFTSIPPLSDAEEQDFRKRTEIAFKMALRTGIDYIFSLSPVLVKIGEQFGEQERRMKLSWDMLVPRVLYRYVTAWLRSRISGRPVMPRDLWRPKGLITFGVDTPVYEEEITRLWGKKPYQFYGTTETMVGAVQAWNKKGLTFLPDIAFWEFIPEEEWRRDADDPDYEPRTVLLPELEVGKQYELVLTHFHGMPLVRYRIGDVIRVVDSGDAEAGVQLPQVVFQARASEIIDLAGLTQVDERTMLQAIVDSGIRYEDWCARKEYHGEVGYLRLYIELREDRDPREIEQLLERELYEIDADYRDLEGWLGQKQAILVTVLSPETFHLFYEEKAQRGEPMARLKPARINPSDEDLERLLKLSQTVRTAL